MIRITRLQRYVLADCFSFFLLAVTAFTGVLLTVQLLHFSDLVVNRGVAGVDILMMFVAVVPTFLEIAIPMAAVVGVMLALARLSSDAELIVMRASGVSLFQVLPAVIIFGFLLSGTGIAVSQYLKPWGYKTVAALLFKIAQDRSTAGLEAGVFNKLGQITLYPEEINYQTGELTRVLLDERQGGESRRIFFAQKGIMHSDSQNRSLNLELTDGEIHEQISTPPITGAQPLTTQQGVGGTYSVTRFSSNSVDIGPEMLGSDSKDAEAPVKTLFSSELRDSREWYKKAVQETSGAGSVGIPLDGQYRNLLGDKTPKEITKRLLRLDTELSLRWSAPFAVLVLAMVAFPLGVQPPRGQSSWNAGISLVIGLGLFLLYYGLLSIGFALAERRALTPLVAVWLPNVVAAMAGLWLNIEICNERYQSVGEIFTSLASRAPRWPRRRS